MMSSGSRSIWRWLSLLLLLLCAPCLGEPPIEFDRSKLKIPLQQLEFADLNGDGPEDILSIGWRSVRVFLQDPKKGFDDARSAVLELKGSSVVMWPAKVDEGRQECLLLLDARGIRAMRLSPDAREFVSESLIAQPTMIPEDGDPGVFFPLAVKTTGPRPLLLLPTRQGLEVWRYDASKAGWSKASVLGQVPQTAVLAGGDDPYVLDRFLNLTVADVNRDGREDVVIRRVLKDPGVLCLDVYEQTADSLLPEVPSQRIERRIGPDEWLGVYDLNRDGRLDLLETKSSDSQIMLPGTSAGRVTVRVLLAGSTGAWPDTPTVVLRKRDWQKRLPMIDIDADGCIDLAMGHVSWSSRDDLIRALEARRMKCELRLHFCEDGRKYPETPDSVIDVTLYTGLLGFNPDQFGTVMTLSGDFNGDGRRDLLVRSAEHDLSIHYFRSREQAYMTRPDLKLTLDTSNPAELLVRDLNGDGISDIIAKVWWDDEPARIYLSRRKP